MAGNIKNFTDSGFENEVEKSPILSIVDFWAEWCSPCRMIAPIIEELGDEYGEKINIGKLNVDKNPKTATKFGIRSIPTLLFFKDGKVIQQMVGVRPKAEIQKIINENI